MASDERNKRLRASTSGDTCVTCCRDVEETGIECNWCYCWEHYDCAGLTEGEYSMLSNSSSKIMFFCTWCYKKVLFALKIKTEAQSNKDMFEASFSTINTKLSELHSNVAAVIKSLEVQPGEQHKSSTNCGTADQSNVITLKSPFEHLASSIVKEQNEKEKRHLNLILHNVPESVQAEASARKQEDIDRITQLLNSRLGVKASINNAIRIGKKDEKSERSRLLKITVSNLQEKTMILHNKLKLRDKENPEDVRKIYITVDYTPLEQKKNKQLREKLKELNKDGNHYVIKNGIIVQRRSQ